MFTVLGLSQAGDTIAMWLPECSEKHVAQLAAARVGMVVAEVDQQLTSPEAIGKVLEECGATVRERRIRGGGGVYRVLRLLLSSQDNALDVVAEGGAGGPE